MMEVVATTGLVGHAKLQSNVTTDKPTPNFLQAGCPSCHPINSVRALPTTTTNNNNQIYIAPYSRKSEALPYQ